MAKLKRLLLWGGILLIGGILMLGAAANEMMSSILGDNQQTNITEDMLNGLPDWITPEMVQLLEYMEEKAEITYFTVYAPDQFEYIHNPEFDRLIPVENKNPELPKKKGFFRRKQKQGVV